jgi:hypothetical protein
MVLGKYNYIAVFGVFANYKFANVNETLIKLQCVTNQPIEAEFV